MRAALLLLCLHVASALALPTFAAWRAARRVTYPNSTVAAQREAAFARNMLVAAAHNANPASTFTMGATRFADLDAAEFAALLSAPPPPAGARAGPSAAGAPAAPPASVDWRASGCIGAVRNQGQCGSAWAVCATEELEWACCLAAGGGRGNFTSLSEEELEDCASRGPPGCAGGFVADAWAYIKSGGGLCSAADYPAGAPGTCRDKGCPRKCRALRGRTRARAL